MIGPLNSIFKPSVPPFATLIYIYIGTYEYSFVSLLQGWLELEKKSLLAMLTFIHVEKHIWNYCSCALQDAKLQYLPSR